MLTRPQLIPALFVATLLWFTSWLCAAQTPSKDSNSNATATPPPYQDLTKDLPPGPTTESSTGDSAKAMKPPAAPPANVPLDEPAKGAYIGALRSYYEYLQSGYEHRKSAFAWQLLSSKIIFFTVIALVLSGVYFSGVQFHSSLRAGKATTEIRKVGGNGGEPSSQGAVVTGGQKPKSTAQIIEKAELDAQEGEIITPNPLSPAVTQLEASLQGIRVSSPVLGVIILALSFLFFYLYLKYVYPINEIF